MTRSRPSYAMWAAIGLIYVAYLLMVNPVAKGIVFAAAEGRLPFAGHRAGALRAEPPSASQAEPHIAYRKGETK